MTRRAWLFAGSELGWAARGHRDEPCVRCSRLDGAEIHSCGWVAESSRTFTMWPELPHPHAVLALAADELGAGPNPDQRARVVFEPETRSAVECAMRREVRPV